MIISIWSATSWFFLLFAVMPEDATLAPVPISQQVFANSPGIDDAIRPVMGMVPQGNQEGWFPATFSNSPSATFVPTENGPYPSDSLLQLVAGEESPPTEIEPLQPLKLTESACLFEGYYDPFSSLQFAYGPDRWEPYRMGWLSYDDGAYLFSEPTSPVPGTMQVTEWNSWLRYATHMGNGWMFAWTGVFNSRYWQGPSGVAMPPEVNILQSDFELTYLSESNWTAQLGFTPQINSDFQRSLTSNAYMFDGRGVVLYRLSPEWTVAAGIVYWNRVHNYLLPYGGVIWTPRDRWELKLMFPKSRLSRYMGNYWGSEWWSYTSVEFNVEAYQVDIEDTRTKERAQFLDYRWMKGFAVHRGNVQFFFEGGLSFGRQVSFSGNTPDYSIGNAFLWRSGIVF